MVAGLVAMLYAMFSRSRSEPWLSKAEKAEGIIFELNSERDSNSNDVIVVRFVTSKLEWITARYTDQWILVYSGQYNIGDKVEVLYNPENPNQFKLVTKQSESSVRAITAIIGFVLFVVGGYLLIIRG